MNPLTVVVTSGGTREKIDDVRVLTNISSGKLGAGIANKFLLAGHKVHYVAPKGTVEPIDHDECHYQRWEVSNVETVMSAMRILVPQADIVIHPMAVSDFTFDYKGAVKCGSNSPEDFVDHMRQTIKTTPKVISNFRKWNAKAVLVGFKFTSGKTEAEMTAIAHNLMQDNKLDMVFANDKKAMEAADAHVGKLITRVGTETVVGKENIAQRIYTVAIVLSRENT